MNIRSASRLLQRCLLGLQLTLLPLSAAVLSPYGATWKYLDNGTDQGAAWRAPAFADAGWASGPAQLGYGDGDEATVVSYGPNSAAKYITTYFRRSFTVGDASVYASLTVNIRRDDGVVLYLNGTEIYRNNMPAGAVAYTTLASTAASDDGNTVLTQTGISTAALLTGNNVLAAEIHQNAGSSSDITFDLELLGETPGLPSVTRGPYLQKSTPTSMTIQWRTSVASDSRVRYGTTAGNLDQTAADAASVTDHVVTLSNLAPNTRYFYAVGTTAADLSSGTDHTFYSAPPPGTRQAMRFWILGDAGTGSTGQANVRNRYYNFTTNRYTDLLLMLGDNAYNNGTDAEYQSYFFNMYAGILRQSAAFSTVGNHDTAGSSSPNISTTPYFQIFTHPEGGEGGGVATGTEKYYSFNYGNVHFVCLDSMTSTLTTNGPMLTWLRQDLAQNTNDWLVAFFHHPPYTKGSHDSDNTADSSGRMGFMRSNALPILEANGVDLVLTGHSHSYERSFLLDGHYGPSTSLTPAMKLDAGSGREDGSGAYQKADAGPTAHQGAVYIVAGSAGQIGGGTLNHPAMYLSLNQLCSLVIDIDGDRMTAVSLTDTGATNDYFTLLKGPPANNPPAVAITAPVAGASFNEPATINLATTASDSDGSVVSVAFYAGATLIGTDSTAPFAITWSGVAAGNYTLTAIATDNLGAQAQSTPVGITVNSPQPPAAPSGLAAVAVNSTRIDLTWTDGATNETGFKIERSGDGFSFSEIASLPADTTAFADTTVAPNSTYFYRAYALNSGGPSAYSATVTATTPVAPPAAPTGLAATAVSSTQVNLTWVDASGDETGFVVERSTNNVAFNQVASLGANVTAWSDTTTVASRTYYYRVRAVNAGGNSAWSNTATVTTPAAVPAAPAALTATALAKRKIRLTWTDASNNESGFKIERSTNGTTWTQVATAAANATTYTNSGLSSGTTYFYRVRAYNAAGDSAYSNTASATASN